MNKQISFTSNDVLNEKIDELLNAEGSFLSRGAVIRAAIAEFYDTHRPKYIYDRSAKDRAKRLEMDFEKKFEDMSDLEFAESFNPLIVPARDGSQFAVFLGLGSSLQILPVTGMKKWKDQAPFISITEGHVEDLKSRKDTKNIETLTRLHNGGWIKNFSDEFNIDLKPYLDANPIPSK